MPSADVEWFPALALREFWRRSLLPQTEFWAKYNISWGEWVSWVLQKRGPMLESAARVCVDTRGEVDLHDWLRPERRAKVLEHPAKKIPKLSPEDAVERWRAMASDARIAEVDALLKEQKLRHIERAGLIHIATEGELPMEVWLEPALRRDVVRCRDIRAKLTEMGPTESQVAEALLLETVGRSSTKSLHEAGLRTIPQIQALTWYELRDRLNGRFQLADDVRRALEVENDYPIMDTTLRATLDALGHKKQIAMCSAFRRAGIRSLDELLETPVGNLAGLGLGPKARKTVEKIRAHVESQVEAAS